MAYFAQRLDGTVTVGQAVAYAKQQFASEKTVFSPYEDKVLMEAVFYGLPMYRVQGTGPVPPPPAPLLISPDPASTLTVASFGLEMTVNTDLVPVSTSRGSYYRANDTTLGERPKPSGR